MELRKIYSSIFILWLILPLLLMSNCTNQQANNQHPQKDTTRVTASTIIFKEMLKNPYANLKLTRQQYKGKLVYDHYCAVCHGETGDGNGFNAYNLKSSFQVEPFNFTDSTAMAQIGSEGIEKAIRGGGTAVGKSQYMPPWGKTLRADEIQAVIQYLYTLLRKSENLE